jgi:uncharacterized membrane protein YtjA (UPF0391 family)
MQIRPEPIRRANRQGTTFFNSRAYNDQSLKWSFAMLRYAIIFFIIAIIAGVLGFGGIAGASSQIAVLLFWVFVVLFVFGLIAHLFGGRGPRL